jgi:predicted P-loop ATPase
MTQHASGSEQLPSPQDMIAWAEFYAFKMQWVIQPIHRWTGVYAANGRKICSCSLTSATGEAWHNCNPDKPGKHPWVGWKQTPMETPEQGYAAFRQVFDKYGSRNGVNIGVRTGSVSGFFAVDLDIGEMKNGFGEIQDWMQKEGLSWDDLGTLSATTGGGGMHLLYQYPPGVQKITTLAGHPKMGAAVDIKGDGGFILVAPSFHNSGRCYQWRDGGIDPSFLRAAPKKLINNVEKKTNTPGLVDTSYTPSLDELKDYADELQRKKSKRSSEVGKNMLEALGGKAIADDGGAHDAYRDIMYFVAKKWPTCNADEILTHFQESVEERFSNKPDASTGMSNLRDSMITAISKANEEAQQWTSRVAINDQGHPIPTDPNMVLYFEHHPAWQGVFGYNKRTNRPVFLRKPPTEVKHESFDLTRDKSWITLWFQDKAKMTGRITQGDIQSSILAVSHKSAFDPLQQDILNLRGTWDGVPRLETMFQRCAGTPDNAWTRTVAPLWFKSLVARILWPGCQCDNMLILEGEQGLRKSSFFRALLPDPTYFSDTLNRVHLDVESIRLLHSGPAIFEIGELSGLKKHEVEEIKAFISARSDELRPLFEGYRKTDRRCIFVGTTNRDDYLRDETGGRRFWPLKVNKNIDLSIVYAERSQWFAEALFRLEQGERWHIDGQEEHDLAAVEQDARFEEDIWYQQIAEYLADKNKSTGKSPKNASSATEQMNNMLEKTQAGDFVTVSQVAENALKIEMKNAKGVEGARINRVLRKLNWLPGREYVENTRIRGWHRPKTPDGTP